MKLDRSVLRFLVVGSLATALHYAIFGLLHHYTALPAVVATSIGFAVSAVFNFAMSYTYTFGSDAQVSTAAMRYAAVCVVGAAINAGIFRTLTAGFDLPYPVAQVLATGTVLVWNYLFGRFFVFNYKPETE